MLVKFKTKNQCRLCKHHILKKVLDLPETVPGEQLKKRKNDKNVNLIPIDHYMCSKCKHVQLIHVPYFKKLWGKEYTYKPSDNPKLIKHFSDTVSFFKNNFEKKINFAFEIGSNDGIFLKQIKREFNSRVLGIDPSDEPVALAKKNNIPTIKNFFNYSMSKKIKKKYGSPDLIIANNVFAHMDDMHSIVRGIDYLLKENGYFIFEASYLLDVVNKHLIGTMIHEHVSIHSIYSLKPFLSLYNLQIIGLKHVDKIQGGAIVGIAIKSKKIIQSNIVKKFINKEKENNLTTIKGLKKFNNIFHLRIKKFKNQINRKYSKNSIVGYGAARSAPLIIDLFDLRNKIEYIIDDNPRKINKFLSIGNIPIYNFKNKKNNLNNKLIFILGWAQTERIVLFLKKNKIKANIATIFPKFQIIKIS